MTEQSDKKRIDLKTTQVAAGSMASVTSAVAASQLGVAGTLIGAGVGSVIGTVAGAFYEHYLDRTHQHVRSAVPYRTTGSKSAVDEATGESPAAVETSTTDPNPARAAVDTSILEPDTAPVPVVPTSHSSSQQPPVASPEDSQPAWAWLRSRRLALAASAAAALGIAIVVLTGFEAVTGQPVSAGSGDGGTSIGRVFGGSSTDSGADPTLTPSPEPSTSEGSTPSPTATSPSPTATEPAATPQPSTQSTSPTAEPVPQPTPPNLG
jgi:hypothetical protein